MQPRRLAMLAIGLATLVMGVAGTADVAFGARKARHFGSGSTTTTAPPRSTTTTSPSSFTSPSQLRPVGSPVLSDADASSRVRRSSWEPRPDNATQNQTVPTSRQLSRFYAFTGQWGSCDNLRQKVTGNFRGTTDEIIQWAAWKWGLPEETVRAAAVTESWWRMSTVGDNGQSFGLMQIKNVDRWHGGTYPLSKDATAFNVDYYAGMVRHYFEGCAAWMKDYAHNGYAYRSGDLAGSLGAWYSGDWHSDAAHTYVSDIQRNESNRTWSRSGF